MLGQGPSTESGYGDGGSDADGGLVEQEQFQSLLDDLGATEVFKEFALPLFASSPSCPKAPHSHSSNTEVVRNLWSKLRTDDPELLGHFEQFLSTVSGEMRKTQVPLFPLFPSLLRKWKKRGFGGGRDHAGVRPQPKVHGSR